MDPFAHVGQMQKRATKLVVLAVVANLLLAGGVIAALAYAVVWVIKQVR
jgi:hypothetical protein